MRTINAKELPGLAVRWTAAAGVALTLLAAVALLFFALPQADDFFVAASVRNVGLLKYFTSLYDQYGGRWFYQSMLGLLVSTIDITRFYPVLLLLGNACLVMAFYWYWRLMLGRPPTRKYLTALALSSFALCWASVPTPGETTYWFTGLLVYESSYVMAFVLVAAVSRASGEIFPLWRFVLRAAGLVLLALMATGTNEILALILCGVCALGTAIAFRVRSRNRYLWVIVLAATIAGLLVMALAPGNAVRGKDFPNAGNLIATLLLTKSQVLFYLGRWVSDLKLLAASLFLAMNVRFLSYRPAWLTWQKVPWKWLIPAVWVVFTLAWFLVPSWLTGDRMPARIVSGAHITFLIGWFATLFVWTRWPANQVLARNDAMRAIESVGLLAFGLAMLFTGNTPDAFGDLLHRAPAWQQAGVARYEQIVTERQQGRREIVCAPSPPQPILFSPQDVREEVSFYINRQVAAYWGLESIRVSASVRPSVKWRTIFDAAKDPHGFNRAVDARKIVLTNMNFGTMTPEGIELDFVDAEDQIHLFQLDIAPDTDTMLRLGITGVDQCICYWARKSDPVVFGWCFSQDRTQASERVQEGILLFDMAGQPMWNGAIERIMIKVVSQIGNTIVLKSLELGSVTQQ